MKKQFLPLLSAFVVIFAAIVIILTPLRPQLSFVSPDLKLITTPTPIATQDSWKVYRNEKYGFEFNYPSSLSYLGSIEMQEGVMFYDPQKPIVDQSGRFINSNIDSIFFSLYLTPKTTPNQKIVFGDNTYDYLKDEYSNIFIKNKIAFNFSNTELSDYRLTKILSSFKFIN